MTESEAEINRLKGRLAHSVSIIQTMTKDTKEEFKKNAEEISRLKAVNAELVEAARWVLRNQPPLIPTGGPFHALQVAVARATAPATDTTGKGDASSPPGTRAKGAT